MGWLDKVKEKIQAKEKLFAVLIDPDDIELTQVDAFIALAEKTKVDVIFVGGSLVLKNNFLETTRLIQSKTTIPLVLFPGNVFQVSPHADAILFLNLISGRNPEYLIHQQVLAAPHVVAAGLESVSTGYMLIDGGNKTTVAYISNTTPIPAEKKDIAVSTALAGKLMGNQMIFMDAGSGAKNPIPEQMISAVKKATQLPLIIGGGLKSVEDIQKACHAGADIIVVGNALEENPTMMQAFSGAVHQIS